MSKPAPVQIFGTPKCRDTKAAERFFKDRALPTSSLDVRERGPSKGELEKVAAAVGGLRALFDAESPHLAGRSLGLPSDARLLALLLEEPRLLRTPIVRYAGKATVGRDEGGWSAIAEAAKAAR